MVLPIATVGKATGRGVIVRADETAFPLTLTVSGSGEASCVNRMFPVAAPATVGANVTKNFLVAKGGRTADKGLTPNATFEDVTDETFSVLPPVFVTVTLS
jgi:hypothetical protein